MLRALVLLACVMVIAGGAAMMNGASMILNERGWSQLIAGSFVLTGGFIVLALAGMLSRLETLWETHASKLLSDGAAPAQAGGSADNQAHDRVAFSAESPAAHMIPSVAAPQTDQAEPAAHHTAANMPASFYETAPPALAQPHEPTTQEQQHPPQAAAELSDSTPVFVSLPTADYDQIKPFDQPTVAAGTVQFAPEPSSTREAAAPRPQLKQPSLFEMVQEQHHAYNMKPPAPEPLVETPPVEVKERVLLASYSTGGVGYFMYSDQSIEAEMAIGRYRFKSMDELRGFIETQTGGERVSN